MTKRFGRNQRRRLRERVANMQSDLQRSEKAQSTLESENSVLRHAIARARRVLGDTHIALPTVYRGHHPHPLGSDFYLSRSSKPSVREFLYPDAATSLRQEMLRMHTLLLRIDEDTESRKIHFTSTLDSGTAVYCISHDALMEMPIDVFENDLAWQIAHSLATWISEHVEHLREAGSRSLLTA